MALKDFISSQFIEVIEWLDDSGNTLVYRFPVRGQEIKMGAQLTVREGQSAVFINEGRLADVFLPGRHRLSTRNMPILTKLMAWKHGFNSPFKAEVYFVSTRQFTDQKWGTSNPVIIRDPEMGPLRLRAFGIYSFRVDDPATFIRDLVGTDGNFTTEEITGQLRGLAVSGFSDLLGECKIPVFDLASKYDELSNEAKEKLNVEFRTHGLDLAKFYVENISLPPEVEAMLDKRASMGMVGDMGRYTQFQTAQAIEAAADAPGGAAGSGVGIGAGVAMGYQMMGAMTGGQAPPGTPAAGGAPGAAQVPCVKCTQSIPAGSKFCAHCGEAQGAACVKCKKPLTAGAKFCAECGAPQAANCSKCDKPLAPGAKFCAECGNPTESK
jgi:membrane protease subunit (stomatin/prohibitin family)